MFCAVLALEITSRRVWEDELALTNELLMLSFHSKHRGNGEALRLETSLDDDDRLR